MARVRILSASIVASRIVFGVKMGKVWLRRVRILPAFIIAATILFGVKIGSIWLGVENLIIGSEAQAQTHDPVTRSSKKPEPVATGDNESGAESDNTEAVDADDELQDPTLMSKGELELLQDLSLRREELSTRENGLDMRERLIEVTERRVERKLAEIKEIEANITVLLKQYDDAQEARLKSLVKVYESMKPKDAARIFNNLDLAVLIPVAERMKEVKIAQILSKMAADAAMALTIELATDKKLAASLD